MKTFTVRELDRQPAVVLDACDKEGAVRIRRRDGRSYMVRPEQSKGSRASAADRQRWLDAHRVWLRQTFPKPISAKQTALVDALIGGE